MEVATAYAKRSATVAALPAAIVYKLAERSTPPEASEAVAGEKVTGIKPRSAAPGLPPLRARCQ